MKNVMKEGMKYALVLGVLFSAVYAFGQPSQNFLNDLDTEVSNAGQTIKNIVATICWIFLAVGIGMIIYSAVTDSQRMKFGIISFVAAGLVLTVGYTTGIL